MMMLCAVCATMFPVELPESHARVAEGATRFVNAPALAVAAARWEKLNVIPGYFRTQAMSGFIQPGMAIPMFACTVINGTLCCDVHAGDLLKVRGDQT